MESEKIRKECRRKVFLVIVPVFVLFMFKIKCYGRTELAQLYSPNILPQSAYRKLQSWLKLNPRLCDLTRKQERTYTPAQVARIVKELGEP